MPISSLVLLLLCFLFICGHTADPDSSVFNIMDYGALGDGRTDDSSALLTAWKAACKRENATVIVPSGSSFLVYPVLLAGPCKPSFRLQIDGVVFAPQDTNALAKVASWITISKVSSFTLGGAGLIDAKGEIWWSRSCKRNASYPCVAAATALTVKYSTKVVIEDVKLVNSPQMHLTLQDSVDVTIRRMQIVSPKSSPNTDGIHTHRSSNITIEKCVLETGDDCISIGTNCTDVLVKEVVCGPGHGISVGSLGRNKASEYVSNVRVEDSVLQSTMFGLRVKTWQGGQGRATNLSYSNVMMLNVSHPIIIDQYYCDSNSSFSCGTQEEDSVEVTNVSYKNIIGTSATSVALRFQCSEMRPCNGLLLDNVLLRLASGKASASSFCMNAFGRDSGLVVPRSCLL